MSFESRAHAADKTTGGTEFAQAVLHDKLFESGYSKPPVLRVQDKEPPAPAPSEPIPWPPPLGEGLDEYMRKHGRLGPRET